MGLNANGQPPSAPQAIHCEAPVTACDSNNRLIVFARIPQPGHNKTRLLPALGPEMATAVYRLLVDRTLAAAGAVSLREPLTQLQTGTHSRWRTTIAFTGGSIDAAGAAFGTGFDYAEQIGPELGGRLKHAVSRAFADGAERVVVIGTDCPELTTADIEHAFAALSRHDVVLGPALDGGYYLIGMARERLGMFDAVDWSTERVLVQTLQRAESLGLSVHTLRCLSDIDHPEDLIPLRSAKQPLPFPLQTQAGRLSIIIPTLNEAEHLPVTLSSIGPPHEGLEVIVVDGGSSDATLTIAQAHGCKVFSVGSGRWRQFNAGAAASSGEQLLLLHADTVLPAGYQSEVARVLATGAVCGAFPLRIDAQGLGLRVIEAGVAVRCKLSRMPYGDQALFLRSIDFFNLGGFKPMAIMEDYELVDRLRRQGRVTLADLPVLTSARRWKKKGVLRTTLINQLCVAAYKLGFSDETIARFYRGKKFEKRLEI